LRVRCGFWRRLALYELPGLARPAFPEGSSNEDVFRGRPGLRAHSEAVTNVPNPTTIVNPSSGPVMTGSVNSVAQAMQLDGKICIVTGASSGLGKETARDLAALGATVVLACRNEARGNAARHEISAATANERVYAMTLDLSILRSIDAFRAEFLRRFSRLDVLVNNAAVLWRKRTLTASGLEATFVVNHLGHFALTLGLLDLISRSAPSRIVMVSSKYHAGALLDLTDPLYEKRRYSGFGAYNASKLANVIFTRALARQLGESGVCVNAVHPGEAGTAIARDYGKAVMTLMRLLYGSPKHPSKSTTLFAATSSEAGAVSGSFFRNRRVVPHSPLADDQTVQDQLWSVSESLIRLMRAAEAERPSLGTRVG
jgi:NAD(P)-dependent dehydrogenase (short-subunit alcohol dehydrogenase family)